MRSNQQYLPPVCQPGVTAPSAGDLKETHSMLHVPELCQRPGEGGSESLGWGFAPPGIWDLVRVHILTRSQSQHIAVGIAGEQQGSLATHQVLPSFSLSSCHTNGILYIVLCLFMGMNKSGDCEGDFLLK